MNSKAAKKNLYYKERVLFSMYQQPDWTSDGDYLLVSLPIFSYMSEFTMDAINYRYLMIKMQNKNDHAKIDEIAKELEKVVGANVKIEVMYKKISKTGNVTNIVNYIFYLTIAIMMFLCFFSLTASMSANLYDNVKEIGVLRSMGVTKGRIRMLYFYEALILVNASCLLGIFIGTSVGYTMAL